MSKKYADLVVKLAKNETGYLEKKSNKFLNEKTKNAGDKNWTKYGAWYGLNPAYWCAEYISWIFDKTYGDCDLIYGKSASCEVIRKRFKDKKRYDKTPKVGALVFFSGSRHGGANHIALVIKVSSTHIWTVEGNTSSSGKVVDNGGAVEVKCYARSNSRILGYGHPAYDKRPPVKKLYGGAFPNLPSRGYFKKGDKGENVRRLQKFLIWCGFSVGKAGADGIYGDDTVKAVNAFMKACGFKKINGMFGKKSLAHAKKWKK